MTSLQRGFCTRAFGCAFAGAAIFAAPATAQDLSDWMIEPSVTGRLTYTDNVRLEPEGQEDSDLVLSVSPRLSATRAGGRATVIFEYAPSFRTSLLDESGSRVSQNLSALVNVEAVEDLFFIDARAAIDEVAFSQGFVFEAFNADAANVDTLGVFEVSPYVVARFGGAANAQARYRLQRFESFDDDPGDADDAWSNQISAGIATGDDFQRLRLSADAEARWIDYDDGGDEDRQSVVAGAGYALGEGFIALANVGYDRIDSSSLRDPIDGPYFSAGGEWRPSPATYVKALAGYRYEDPWYLLEARRDLTARTTATVTATRTVDTVQTIAFRDLGDQPIYDVNGNPIDPATLRQLQLLLGDFTIVDALFRRDRIDADLATEWERTNLRLSGFYERRSFVDQDPEAESWGGAIELGRQLRTNLDGAIELRFRETDFAGGGDANAYGASVGLDWRFNPTLIGSASYLHNRYDESGSDDVVENAITIALTKTF